MTKKKKTSIEIAPNFVVYNTASGAEEYFGNGFKFRGPGWYLNEDDCMLVVPSGEVDDPWKSKSFWPRNAKFRFMVFSGNPVDSFDAVVNAPVRYHYE